MGLLTGFLYLKVYLPFTSVKARMMLKRGNKTWISLWNKIMHLVGAVCLSSCHKCSCFVKGRLFWLLRNSNRRVSLQAVMTRNSDL